MQVQSREELQEIEDRQKAGRPRSESSKRAIMDATRRLLTHVSVSKLSIEAIAKKAGVGKTTIYRWWPNKQSVVMEAVFSQPGFNNILPTPANAAEGIRIQIEKLSRQLNGKNGRIVAEIIGDAQAEPDTIRALIDQFFQERYNALYSYIEGGKANGEFRENLDTDAAIDLILGPIIFRLMSGQALDEDFETKLTEFAQQALR